MALIIRNRSIERISIVDDDASARQGYEYSVEDLRVEPVPEEGPLGNLAEFIARMPTQVDAAICDHHLRKRNYAGFNGAEAVAAWYQVQFPALLCTRYDNAELEELRRYLRWIPVMLKPDDLDPGSIESGLERCIAEFAGHFEPHRRPWRTLVRVDDVVLDGPRRWFGAVIPAWEPNEVVRVWLDHLPPEIQVRIAPDVRLHAQVNLGAESYEELYIYNWELQ